MGSAVRTLLVAVISIMFSSSEFFRGLPFLNRSQFSKGARVPDSLIPPRGAQYSLQYFCCCFFTSRSHPAAAHFMNPPMSQKIQRCQTKIKMLKRYPRSHRIKTANNFVTNRTAGVLSSLLVDVSRANACHKKPSPSAWARPICGAPSVVAANQFQKSATSTESTSSSTGSIKSQSTICKTIFISLLLKLNPAGLRPVSCHPQVPIDAGNKQPHSHSPAYAGKRGKPRHPLQ